MPNVNKLDKYFWDHTNNTSTLFKLKRLLEYANFSDLIKVPFKDIKENLKEIDIERLRVSEIRKMFIKKLQLVEPNCSTWDEAIFTITGIKKQI